MNHVPPNTITLYTMALAWEGNLKPVSVTGSNNFNRGVTGGNPRWMPMK